MATKKTPAYTVTAGNLRNGKGKQLSEGDTVTAKDLPDANLDALVQSGHLKPE